MGKFLDFHVLITFVQHVSNQSVTPPRRPRMQGLPLLILSPAAACEFARENPFVIWSLRSGNLYLHADSSVTVWEPRLQSWVLQPVRSLSYWRRNRDYAQADQAPSSSLDESI
jgi:hypothetical protein